MLNDTALAIRPLEKELLAAATLERWLMSRLAEELDEAEEKLDPTAHLAGYGLDSMSALVLTGELEEWLGLELPSTLIWDHPTVRELAEYLERLLHREALLSSL